MKIAFLIHNAYGIGGTIRATGNLASALAARHDVAFTRLADLRVTQHLEATDDERFEEIVRAIRPVLLPPRTPAA
ncbi:hypothetical protein V7793_37645, partial [Streptomyces sp. KLMMK]